MMNSESISKIFYCLIIEFSATVGVNNFGVPQRVITSSMNEAIMLSALAALSGANSIHFENRSWNTIKYSHPFLLLEKVP